MSEAPLRVGIDGFNLALARGTGVATYARALAESCANLGRHIDLVYGVNVPPRAALAQRETLFFAALAQDMREDIAPPRATAIGRLRRLMLTPVARRLVEVPVTGRVIRSDDGRRVPPFDRLFTRNRLFSLGERYLRRYGRLLPVRVTHPPAIMHWTYPVPVRLIGSRNVYTIHDLVPLRLPHLSLEDKRYHERLLHACAANAAHLLTVSEASRRDILAHLPIDPGHVTNTHQALPQGARGDRSLADLGALFGLTPRGYFLFVGAIEPKKNLGRLIEAYLTGGFDVPLVIAGPDAWGAEEELRLLRGKGGLTALQSGRIQRLGYVPTEHLELLVRGAQAVVFPSLYEGFGLPALEAMAVGTPVIASDRGALPEIVGDAALLVDPYAIEAIRAALTRVRDDPALREALGAAGKARARQFTRARFQARIDGLHRQLMTVPANRRQRASIATAMPVRPGE